MTGSNGSATVVVVADVTNVAARTVLMPTRISGAGPGSGITLYQQQEIDEIVSDGDGIA